MLLFHGREILEREVIRSAIQEKYQPIQKRKTYLLFIPPFPIPWSLLASRFFFGDFLEKTWGPPLMHRLRFGIFYQ